MSTPLSKDQIFRVLAERYVQHDSKILKEIAYNLALASTTQATLAERVQLALNRIKAAPSVSEPLRQNAVQSVKSKLSICPICKSSMKTVKLMEDRPAFYCVDHKITVPYPKEGTEA